MSFFRSRYYGYYPPYVTVAERKAHNERMISMFRKKGKDLSPVTLSGPKITHTIWGKAWCDSIEAYSQYDYRLPEGRSYLRTGSVIDLKITNGKVSALVLERHYATPHKVTVKIAPLPPEKWELLKQNCTGKISSLLALAQGKLPTEVLEEFCNKKSGLFPTPQEMELSCDCTDWCEVCKHIAAVLYGIGARLDEHPELIFTLRGIDEKELVSTAAVDSLTAGVQSEIAPENLEDIFGITLDTLPEATKDEDTTKAEGSTKDATTSAAVPSTTQPEEWTAEAVRDLRATLGLSQIEFGLKCDVSNCLVSNWEHGKITIKGEYYERLNRLAGRTQEQIPAKQAEDATTAQPQSAPEEADVISPNRTHWTAQDVRDLRSKLGYTQAEFARWCHVTSVSVSNWELGKVAVNSTFHEDLNLLAQKLHEKLAKEEAQEAQKSESADWEIDQKSEMEAREEYYAKKQRLYTEPWDTKRFRRFCHLYSHSKLARLLGVSATTIRNWESGRTPVNEKYFYLLNTLDPELSPYWRDF